MNHKAIVAKVIKFKRILRGKCMLFLTMLFSALTAFANDAELKCKNLDHLSIQNEVDSFLISKPHLNKMDSPTQVVATTFRNNRCFVVLSKSFDAIGSFAEIVVIDPLSLQINEVSAVFNVPKSLKVGIGSKYWNGQLGKPLYYTELKDVSAYEAYKSITSGVPVHGMFGGCVPNKKSKKDNKITYLPTGKLKWDPTQNRKWQLASASFSLNRGFVNEVDDISAWQLDQDFSGYLEGSNACTVGNKKYERGAVQPWSALLVTYFSGNKEVTTDFDSQFEGIYKNAPPDANFGNVIVRLKYDEATNKYKNDESCLAKIEKFDFVKKSQRSSDEFLGTWGLELEIAQNDLAKMSEIEKLECVSEVFEIAEFPID